MDLLVDFWLIWGPFGDPKPTTNHFKIYQKTNQILKKVVIDFWWIFGRFGDPKIEPKVSKLAQTARAVCQDPPKEPQGSDFR